jgi:hypothetical protein
MDDLEAGVREALESHCRECAACADELRRFTALWNELGALGSIEAPASLGTRFAGVLEAYEAGRESPAPGWTGAFRERLAGWWPVPPAVQAAAAVLILAAGLALGAGLGGGGSSEESLRSLEGEVRELRRLVGLSMLGQQTASQRLQGVTWTSELDEADPEVQRALLDTLNYDPNANVRLAVIDALGQFGDEPQVRDGLVASLERQEAPIVQVFLIDLLVELGETRSLAALERLSRNEDVHEAVRERAAWGISQLG